MKAYKLKVSKHFASIFSSYIFIDYNFGIFPEYFNFVTFSKYVLASLVLRFCSALW
jgi:hypothetical protein